MKHRFLLGDAAEVLKRFSDNSIDLVISSATFGNIRMPKGWKLDMTTIGQELCRVLKPGGINILHTQDVIINGVKSLKTYSIVMDWVHNNPFGLWCDFIILRDAAKSPIYWKTRPRILHEYAFAFLNQKAGDTKPNVYHNEHRLKNGICMGNILDYSKDTLLNDRRIPKDKKNVLNTPTPFTFARDMILMFSEKNDIVLDCFCGIGTVNVMAETLGRNSIGIDISKDAIEMTKKELDNIKNQIL